MGKGNNNKGNNVVNSLPSWESVSTWEGVIEWVNTLFTLSVEVRVNTLTNLFGESELNGFESNYWGEVTPNELQGFLEGVWEVKCESESGEVLTSPTYPQYLVVGVGIITPEVPTTLEVVQQMFFGKVVTGVTPNPKVNTRVTTPKIPIVHKSTVTSPVTYVHTRIPQLLELGYTRKQIITTIVLEGVSTHTVTTQYQRYMSVVKGKL